MRNKRASKRGALHIALAICFLSCGGSTLPAPSELMAFFPEAVGQWKKHDVVQEYAGDELYVYINGGAEIYYEYGFERVAVQDYQNPSGKTIGCEIYAMTTPASAYGIYSFKRSAGGRGLDIGSEARLEDYYLNLWQGRYLLTLTGFDTDDGTIQGIEAIAREIARLLPEAEAPGVKQILPAKDLEKASIKYFVGPLSLFNSHRFFTENVFAFQEGWRGDYASGYSLFVFTYADAEEGISAFQRVRERFRASPRYRSFRPSDSGGFEIKDADECLLRIRPSENHILIVMGEEDARKAESIFSRILANLQDD